MELLLAIAGGVILARIIDEQLQKGRVKYNAFLNERWQIKKVKTWLVSRALELTCNESRLVFNKAIGLARNMSDLNECGKNLDIALKSEGKSLFNNVAASDENQGVVQ